MRSDYQHVEYARVLNYARRDCELFSRCHEVFLLSRDRTNTNRSLPGTIESR